MVSISIFCICGRGIVSAKDRNVRKDGEAWEGKGSSEVGGLGPEENQLTEES